MYHMMMDVPNVLNSTDDPRLLLSEPFRAVHYVFGLFFPDIPALPGRALLRTLGTLGFGEEAARGILLRLRRRGFLVSRREGREATYALSPASYRLVDEISRRATQPPPAWGGSFEALLVQIPAAERAFREQLRRHAAFAGFGTPLPGLLVTADPAATAALEPLLTAAPLGVAVIHARLAMNREEGRRLALDAWSLEPLAERILQEAARMAAVAEQVDGETMTDAEAVALLWRTIGPYFELLSGGRPRAPAPRPPHGPRTGRCPGPMPRSRDSPRHSRCRHGDTSRSWPDAPSGRRDRSAQPCSRSRSQQRSRASSGSNSGVEPATATVTGYRSPMYWTASLVPATASSTGRYAISRCFPTEGPVPADVT
jgi:hypothetical protein